MTTMLKQGTPEWRAARVGRITASGVAAILNMSPFTTRKQHMKRMVDEVVCGPAEMTGPHLQWGIDNEAKARAIYEFLYLTDDGGSVDETGFWADEWDGVLVGCSPDGLVGEDGLTELKCPYSLRDEASPVFTSIHAMPHYMHQVQMQLAITGRKWCDFFQWAPKGHLCERVNADPLWWDANIDALKEFFLEFQVAVEKASTGGAEEKCGRSARWFAAAEDYLLAKREKKDAEAREEDAKNRLKELCDAAGISQCKGAGISISKSSRVGQVNYKSMVEALVEADVIASRENEFRGKASTVWTVTETKEKDSE